MPTQADRETHHPTKEKLISTVVEMLDERPDEIGIEEILRTAGISTGSMYHHFRDVDDLIANAYVRRFSRQVDENIVLIDEGLSKVSSQEEMKATLSAVTRVTQAPDRAPVRYERARIVAMAERDESLREKLREEQKRLTDALERLFAQMQENGWMRGDFDPRAAAVFIQAYTLGKVVDDFAEEPIDPEAWNRIIDGIVEDFLAA